MFRLSTAQTCWKKLIATVHRLTPCFSIRRNCVRCVCCNNRVEISVTDYRKHNLPVALDCEWQHAQGIAKGEVSCSTADGKPAESFDDIALCMKETACPVTGARRCRCQDPSSRPLIETAWFSFTGEIKYATSATTLN